MDGGRQDSKATPGVLIGTAGWTVASFSNIEEVEEDGHRFG